MILGDNINGRSREIEVEMLLKWMKEQDITKKKYSRERERERKKTETLDVRFCTISRISVTTARISNFLIASIMLLMTTIKQIKFVHITSVISAKVAVLKFTYAYAILVNRTTHGGNANKIIRNVSKTPALLTFSGGNNPWIRRKINKNFI